MKERNCIISVNGKRGFIVRRRARDMIPAWEKRSNPWLWFSWMVLADGSRDYRACGVRTYAEAVRCLQLETF
jgi:hypothetical protein